MTSDRTASETSRRGVLKLAGTTVAATTGLALTGGVVAAETDEDCTCHQCWLDLKPGSCPNAVNPDAGGVVSVAAGWPGLDPETVALVPSQEDWGDCSERRSDYAGPDCDTVEDLLADDRYAVPVRAERYDEDGDGDDDWVFKFDKQAVGFREGVESVVLVGRDAEDDCPVWGVDSVKIVGGNGGGNEDDGSGNGGGRGRGRGRGN